MQRFIRSATLTLLLMATACGGGDDGGTTQPTPTAASITLSSATSGAFVSITETRAVTALVKDASQNVLANATVSWSSSNTSVATVSGSGSGATVTATGNGSATITATSGSVQATLTVDVLQKFATLAVTPASPSLAIGAVVSLAASARDARNTTIGGVTGTTFATSDRTKALVDAAGTVTAIAPGAVTITASLTRDGVTSTANAAVTVSAPAAVASSASVSATGANVFTPTSVTIGVGGSVNWSFTGDHNVLFSGTGAPADIPVTSSGSISRAFSTLGTFNYTCSLHSGMNGIVTVAAPSIFAQMNGANERPTANASTANGAALFTRSGATVSYTVTYQGIGSAPTGLHIHAPATSAVASGIIVDLLTTPLPNPSGVLTGTFTASNIRPISGQPVISLDSLFVLLQTGNAYVNVHSSVFPGGEIRGQTGNP
ncbi:MAG: CHRD domain-containing protein [Gemmatimonadaceae bacterium]|nr:CHRD domain-containing protein [Gemmatimonadaceae bacterium]